MTQSSAGDRLRPWHHSVGARTVFELKMLLRNPESLLVMFVIPLGFLGFDLLDSEPAAATARALAISTFGAAFVATGIATAFERKYGVLAQTGTTPLGRGGLITAKAVATLGLVGVQLVLVVALVASLAAAEFVWLAAATGPIVIGCLCAVTLAMAIAGTVRAEAALGLINALFVVLIAMTALPLVAEQTPPAVARLASVGPLGALVDLLTASLAGGLDAQALAVLLVWTGAAAFVVRHGFDWMPSTH